MGVNNMHEGKRRFMKKEVFLLLIIVFILVINTNLVKASTYTGDGSGLLDDKVENIDNIFTVGVTAEIFMYMPPNTLVYDGNQKEVQIIPKEECAGIGDIAIKYYDSDGKQLNSAPVNAGTYSVKIDVAQSSINEETNDITADAWNFTIKPKTISVSSVEVNNKTYDESTNAEVKNINFDGLASQDMFSIGTDYNITAKFDSKDVGTDKNVTVTINLLNTENANNYCFRDSKSTTYIAKASIIAPSYSELGQENTVLDGITQYIDLEGTTSAILINDKTWLKEDALGISTLFGLDNSNNVLSKYSSFYSKIITKDNNQKEYLELYNKLDNDVKNKINSENSILFKMGVKDYLGNKYSEFSGPIEVYIQIPDDWKEKKIRVRYLSSGQDEIMGSSIVTIMSPIGLVRCLKVKTTHFSPFIMYQVATGAGGASVQSVEDTDNNTKKEVQLLGDKKNEVGTYSTKVVKINDVPRTGDKTNIALWNMLAFLCSVFIVFHYRCIIYRLIKK